MGILVAKEYRNSIKSSVAWKLENESKARLREAVKAEVAPALGIKVQQPRQQIRSFAGK